MSRKVLNVARLHRNAERAGSNQGIALAMTQVLRNRRFSKAAHRTCYMKDLALLQQEMQRCKSLRPSNSVGLWCHQLQVMKLHLIVASSFKHSIFSGRVSSPGVPNVFMGKPLAVLFGE